VAAAKKGDRVSFQLGYVFLPDAREVLSTLTDEVEVEGTVVDFSDSGNTPRAFAVVELHSGKRVVVPVERLRAVTLCHLQPGDEYTKGL
jgi:hypothetical protein